MYDIYVEDACYSLMEPFRSLIAQLVLDTIPLTELTMSGRPTLSQYLFPRQVSCINNRLQSIRVDYQESIWRALTLEIDNNVANDIHHWTQSYHPSSIEAYHSRRQDVLAKPPTRVIVT